jgi:hypothetical protein
MKRNRSEKMPSFLLRREMKRNRSEKMPSFLLRREMEAKFICFNAKKGFFRLFSHLKRNKNEIRENKAKKHLFRFGLKRNEKIGSETKRNEKILEAKHSENTLY